MRSTKRAFQKTRSMPTLNASNAATIHALRKFFVGKRVITPLDTPQFFEAIKWAQNYGTKR